MICENTPFAANCATCPALAACRHTFGAFYAAKSSGGAGCMNPLAEEHARGVMDALEAARRREAEESQRAASARMVQYDIAAAQSEDATRFAPREWIVTHNRRTYETTAKSEAGAINNVRFKLYGTRPASSLSPFKAEPKRTGNISISSAARRLAALAQAGRA